MFFTCYEIQQDTDTLKRNLEYIPSQVFGNHKQWEKEVLYISSGPRQLLIRRMENIFLG